MNRKHARKDSNHLPARFHRKRREDRHPESGSRIPSQAIWLLPPAIRLSLKLGSGHPVRRTRKVVMILGLSGVTALVAFVAIRRLTAHDEAATPEAPALPET